jgi:hypothetical protein
LPTRDFSFDENSTEYIANFFKKLVKQSFQDITADSLHENREKDSYLLGCRSVYNSFAGCNVEIFIEISAKSENLT